MIKILMLQNCSVIIVYKLLMNVLLIRCNLQTSVSWLNFSNPNINEHLCSGICRLNCSNEDCHTVLTILLTQCWNYHVTKCRVDHCIKYHYMQCLLFIVLENKCVLTTGFSGHLKQGCVHKGQSGLVVKCSGPKWLASGY